MVLSWGADREQPSNRVFTGEGNGPKFMFYYEHVAIRGKNTEYKAVELLPNLYGSAFEFYFPTFSKDDELTSEALDFSYGKNAMFERFVKISNVKDVLQQAVNARLSDRNINELFRDMERLFYKAKFNEEPKFGMLRSAIMKHLKLGKFSMFRIVTTFVEAKKVVHDFNISRVAFFGAQSSGCVFKSTQVPKQFGCAMHSKTISRL